MKKIIHLALDVDDKAFHGCGIYEEGGKEIMIELKSKPSIGALMQKLGNIQKEGFELKICYEATYLAFSLARELKNRKINCDVIAPSSIPVRADKTVKTDKVDCREMAQFYRNGLLTIVHIPDEKMEHIRDIVRSRFFIRSQYGALKRHILSTCRRVGLNYRASVDLKSPSYFTKLHIRWLESEISKDAHSELKFNIKMLLSQLRQFEVQLSNYDQEIEKMAEEPEFKKKIESLTCYRGIDTLTAMCLVTELGDITRFSHPRKLTSYVGFDLRQCKKAASPRCDPREISKIMHLK